MGQHDIRRVDKRTFADPDGSHPFVEALCRRRGVDHEGAAFQLPRAGHSRLEKRSTNTALPGRRIDKDAVEERNTPNAGSCGRKRSTRWKPGLPGAREVPTLNCFPGLGEYAQASER